MHMEKDVRAILPEQSKKAFDAIVDQSVLGAGNHISMIGDMIQEIAVRGRDENRELASIIDDIKQVTSFFIATRGEASQAVGNAILMMIHNIDQYALLDRDVAIDRIIASKDDYMKSAGEAVWKIVRYALKLTQEMSTIFVFDYSSTVDQLLSALPENEKKYTIYIAESRIIDGGLPFVMTCQRAGHHIKFIPDVSMMYYLKECDAAFMGAETFYPDGTGFNTTGSDIVGLLCKYYKIPLYFLTPMIKLDIRPLYGGSKNLVFDDMKHKITKNWSTEIDIEKMDFVTPELIGVKPEFIEAFVTEKGIIPANQMYETSLTYSRALRGGTL